MDAAVHERHMRRAIEIARGNPDAPFGTIIADGGRAEVVQALSGEGAKLAGWGTEGIDPEGVLSFLRVEFDGDAVKVSF